MNVLLIILEGLSGGVVPTISARHGVTGKFELHQLDRIASERALTFSSFVNHQHRTDRGTFAILCGAYPRLLPSGGSRAAELVGTQSEAAFECLPWQLARHGYETVYLQAAPLGFMFKGTLMPLIGFRRSYGDLWFQEAILRNKWGVDDLTFFRSGVAMVDELEQLDEPWFLTMLTSGTHHPFRVPNLPQTGPLAAIAAERDPGVQAFLFMDFAVGGFLRQLEERGVLERTLVLITSDETSGGLENHVDELDATVDGSWGLLLALVPGMESPRVIDDLYGQIDIAPSVLDYLGFSNGTPVYPGRSLFRRYENPRAMAFAVGHQIAGISEDGLLYACPPDFSDCSSYRLADQKLYAPGRSLEETKVPGAATESLRRIVSSSMRLLPSSGEERYALLEDADIRLSPMSEDQRLVILSGGSGIGIPANTRVKVYLDGTLSGPADGKLLLTSSLWAQDSMVFHQKVPLESGQRFRLHYSYWAREPIPRLRCQLFVPYIGTPNLALHFDRAEIVVRSDGLGSGQAPGGVDEGVVVEEFSILNGRDQRDSEQPEI